MLPSDTRQCSVGPVASAVVPVVADLRTLDMWSSPDVKIGKQKDKTFDHGLAPLLFFSLTA